NQADDIAYDATTGTYYVAAALGGAFVSTNGVDWEARNNGNSGLGLPATVETINGTVFMDRPLGGLNKSTDQGQHWTSTAAYPGIAASYLLAFKGRLMIAVTGNNLLQDGLYYSDDLGATWTFTQSLFGSFDLTTDGTIIYAAGGGRVPRFSATDGLTWDDLSTTGLPAGFSFTRFVRVGNTLFVIGAVNGTPELYRLDVSSYAFNPATQISQQPTNSPSLLAGDSFTFRVVAGGRNLRYQWYRDGAARFPIGGQTNSTLSFTNLQGTNEGLYSVTITGDFGAVTSVIVGLNVTVPSAGKYDPTFASTVSLANSFITVLDDYSLLGISGGSLSRMDQKGAKLATRTVTGANFQKFIKDSQGRVMLVDPQGNPKLRRIDPVTLLDDPTFLTNAFTGPISAIVEWPGHGYLVGSSRTTPEAHVTDQVVLLNYDGSVDKSFNTGEAPFPTTSNTPSWVWVSLDGKIYALNGNFPGFGFVPVQLVRLTATGAVDTTFASGGVRDVQWIQGLSDGRMLVVAGFNYDVKIVKPDGSFDTTFNVAGARLNNLPTTFVEQPDGKLIIGGKFTQYGGKAVGKHMRLNADGTLDPTFFSDVSYNGNATVFWISYDPHGYLYYVPTDLFSSSTFQRSTVHGLVRVFVDRAALSIFSQTGSQRVGAGESFTLSVNAVGTSAIAYQWFKDGVLIPGATSATYVLNNFGAADNGTYTVQVKNSSGTLTSRETTLKVIGAPEILTFPQPANQLLGSNYTFSVTAQGGGTLAYQWFKNGSAIAGATKNTLVLTNLQYLAAGDYTVTVSNALGLVTTPPASLTIFEITGALIQSFAPGILDNAVSSMDVMPDGSLLLGGTFSRPGNANHPWFTRMGTNGAFVAGWTNDPPGGVTGIGVYCVKALANGQAIVAGQYSRIAGVNRAGYARLNADGTVDASFGLDANGPNSAIYAFEPLPDGKFLVGGNFTQWGTGQRIGLVRLNADGTLDNTLDLKLNDWVHAIVVLPDGRAYVGGRFSTIGGVSRPSLALLKADGSVDATFSPPFIDGQIYSMGLASGNRLVIGGSFATIDFQNHPRLARLNPDGSVDASFAFTNFFNNLINSVQVQLNDKVIVVGGSGVARVLPTGGIDPTFQITPPLFGPAAVGRVTPEGRLYLGGSFTSPGRYVEALTTDKAELAITSAPSPVEADLGGSVTLSVGIYTVSAATYQWLKDGEIIPGATNASLVLSALTKASAGGYSVRVVNATRSVTSDPAVLSILAEPVLTLQPVTASRAVGDSVTFSAKGQGASPLAYQWRKNGVNLPGATGPTYTIASAATADAGVYDAVLSNGLGSVTTDPAGLGVFLSAGKVDASFNAGTGANSTVFAAAVLPNGNIAVGGSFNSFNGQGRARFAMLDSTGALVNLASNPGFFQTVTAIAAQPDGKFFVTTLNTIGRFNADGSVDKSFPSLTDEGDNILISGNSVYFTGYFGNNPGVRRFNLVTGAEDATFKANATVTSGWAARGLYAYPDGKLLVSDFNNGIRRLNADGSQDNSLVSPQIIYSGGGSRPVYAVQAMADGHIWIGGTFTSVASQPRNYLARLNADGSLDATLPDAGLNATVRALVPLGNDLLVAGDFFPSLNSTNYRGLVKISGTTGKIDPAFGPVLANTSAFALAPVGTDKVIVGGSFNSPAGVARVIVKSGVSLAIAGQPGSLSVKSGDSPAFTVGWVGGGDATYQWSKNGQPISGATAQTLVLPSVTTADAGSYTVTISASGETVTSGAATLKVDGVGGGTGGTGTFAAWKAQFNFPAGLDGENADADGDKIPNIVEFALGSNPTSAASGKLPTTTQFETGGKTYPAVTFTRSQTATSVTLQVTVSSTVAFGDSLGSAEAFIQDLGDGTERVTVRSAVSVADRAQQFLKVDVVPKP
ncbi:MAG TPA: hypothetical protein VHH73_10685, partial [Verrucomicrobiae bacterium]|nr:hypothetical protein [Verrucomicrobiae bacterium]